MAKGQGRLRPDEQQQAMTELLERVFAPDVLADGRDRMIELALQMATSQQLAAEVWRRGALQ